MKGYLFEVVVNKGSSSVGLTLYKFKKQAGEDIDIIGLFQKQVLLKKFKIICVLKKGQILVIKKSAR